jgi:hypothetical protein
MGHLRVWVNGQKTNDTPYGTLPSFDVVVFGLSAVGGPGAIDEEAWFDDIAFNHQQIGCTN